MGPFSDLVFSSSTRRTLPSGEGAGGSCPSDILRSFKTFFFFFVRKKQGKKMTRCIHISQTVLRRLYCASVNIKHSLQVCRLPELPPTDVFVNTHCACFRILCHLLLTPSKQCFIWSRHVNYAGITGINSSFYLIIFCVIRRYSFYLFIYLVS